MAWLAVPAQVVRSASFYPLTLLYVSTVAVLAAVIQGYTGFISAAMILLAFTLVALMASMRREVINLTIVMSEQRAQLIERIDELTRILRAHGFAVPPPSHTEEEARTMAADEDPEVTATGGPTLNLSREPEA